MRDLSIVLENYLTTKTKLGGKATNSETLDQASIKTGIPRMMEILLEKKGYSSEFKVEGSFGNGNIARVPWVGVFNRKITTSAQNGYYIVLLFSEDMTCCYLSLNQGFTDFKNKYSIGIALQKIKQTSKTALHYIKPNSGSILGPINLSATGDLGKGYELGAIESYNYNRDSLPAMEEFESNFFALLDHYDTLFGIAGASLHALTPISEFQYQQAVLEKASASEKASEDGYREPAGGVPIPPKIEDSRLNSYRRDPVVAGLAIKLAGYKCEIDSAHKTFISNTKGAPYVEAHHLIPLSKQEKYKFSLDVVANVVALCPNCHRMLHHGRLKDKRKILVDLLSSRKGRLIEKEIFPDEKELIGFYGKELLEEEA